MAGGRALARLAQVHQTGLDGDAAGVGRQLLRAEAGGDMPAAEAGAGLVASLAQLAGTGLVGLAQHLVDEGLAALLWCPRPGVEAFFSMLIAFLAHADDSSKLIAVRRARHAVGPVLPQAGRQLRHLAAPALCRFHPPCRLVASATKCCALLSCPPLFSPALALLGWVIR
ncbi:hypothetical protein D3C84_848500 [compost metagenome]